MTRTQHSGFLIFWVACWLHPGLAASAAPAAKDALALKPIQPGVPYDMPTGEDVGKSTVHSEKARGGSGWVVRGPGGQLLRRFLDTNGDNRIDHWCYYQNGGEIYWDVDADFNGKAEQYRWMGLAGMRWGIDQDEDGRIDRWKQISAEEVTAELVTAIVEKDSQRFARLLISKSELVSLGLPAKKAAELEKQVAQAPARFANAVKTQRTLGKDAQWVHFGATLPGLLPAGTGGSTRDLVVYENVVAMVESGGRHGQLQIGTLVRAGDAWRAIDIPSALMDEQQRLLANGYFLQAPDLGVSAATPPPEEAASQEMQQLVAKLEAKEQAISQATKPTDIGRLNDEMADILEELTQKSKTAAERGNWIRQFADSINTAIQAGGYPGGSRRLGAMIARLPQGSDLAAYVRFRQLSADYTLSLQEENADLKKIGKIQEDWIVQLQEFVEAFPESGDATEAMFQLAIAQEFAGNDKAAIAWYDKVVQRGGTGLSARKATGAKTRLESVGKPLTLRGPGADGRPVDLAKYRGRLTLLQYWATWCEPCKADLKPLMQLYTKFHRRGFEIVGVSLDNEPAKLAAFLKANRLPWPTIFEKGGLDSRPALELGVLTLPTMLLVDEKGNVLNRNVSVPEIAAELEKRLPEATEE